MKKSEVLQKKNVILVIPGHKIIGGVDTGRKAMVAYVTQKVPLDQLSKQDIIPKEIEGLESDVQITKQINALSRLGKYRPMPGGVNGGHPNVTYGTISPLRIKGRLYIYANAHVIGDCNDGEIGDQVWQPGSACNGTPNDTVGNLYIRPLIHFEVDGDQCPWANRWSDLGNRISKHIFRSHWRIPAPIYEAINRADCAVALPIDEADLLEEILDIGKIAGFAETFIADAIRKSGATSDLTHGTVLDITGASRVNYGSRGTAIYENQIVTTAIAQPGDSGSLVVNAENKVIGALFAGNDEFTIVNKISDILEALGLN